MSAAGVQRIGQQQAFLLHVHHYRETSLIVDAFTRDHGRVGLLAKGARRPHSQWRGVLMAFRPLLLDWSGNGELKTLVRAEWQAGLALLTGRALLCAYYLNELLLRLTVREDAHPELFEDYDIALHALASRDEHEVLVLRRFELALLQQLGHGLDLAHEAESGDVVRPTEWYAVAPEQGVILLEQRGEDAIPGHVLLALAEGALGSAEVLAYAKTLLRRLIHTQLGGAPLHSRRILMELQEL